MSWPDTVALAVECQLHQLATEFKARLSLIMNENEQTEIGVSSRPSSPCLQIPTLLEGSSWMKPSEIFLTLESF